MAVIIRPKFNATQIAKMMAGKRIAIHNAIQQRLQFIGETFVVNARNTNTYMDQTGNLRSSIGYVVYHNGQLLSDDFPGDKPEGVAKARELATDVAADHPTGFVLVCVAGMDYAASVEAKGYDVITNSTLETVQDLKNMVKDLKSKIARI